MYVTFTSGCQNVIGCDVIGCDVIGFDVIGCDDIGYDVIGRVGSQPEVTLQCTGSDFTTGSHSLVHRK